MSVSVTPEAVVERLKQAQSGQALPATAQQTARRLIDRLSSPVRVGLMGPSGAGKSTLRNVLAGAAVVPEGARLPTSELRFGEAARIVATLGNRSSKEIAGLDFTALQMLSPAFAKIFAPIAVLKKISLLEVVTDDTPADLRAALRWAAQRTDIAIWVTTGFGPEEHALWETMPDELKDHGYLVLNKADALPAGEKAEHTARLQGIATQEFHGFFAVAAMQGLGAIGPDGVADSGAFGASGCDALTKALMRHINLGTQADIDGALMFLSRFEAPAARPVSRNPAASPAGRRKSQPVAPEAPQPLQVEGIVAGQQKPDHAARRDVQETALAQIRSGAGAMVEGITDTGTALAEQLLEHCADAVEDLASTLTDEDPLIDSIMQASDVIVLLHLEKTESAAEDAVITLLQLKRDIEVALAA